MGDALVFSFQRLVAPQSKASTVTGFRPTEDLKNDPLGARSPAPASALGGGGGGGGGGDQPPPQAFGAVYLGQTLAALVTVANASDAPVAALALKVELSTEAGKGTLLYDTTSQPLPKLEAGQRHEFGIKSDIRDLGSHSLVCSAAYLTRDGERRMQARAFSFNSLLPLVVRTKQRTVGEAVLLEATLENATRAPMQLDAVTFFPTPPWAAERVEGGGVSSLPPPGVAGAPGAEVGPLSTLPLVPEGGSSAFLFRLTKSSSGGGSPGSSPPAGAGAAAAGAAADAAGPLGRMEIKWRGPMGEVARLQTQQISMPPQPPREASLALACLPRRVVVGAPFTATLRVQSHVDRRMGPLKIALAFEPQAPGSASSSPSKPASFGRRGPGGSSAGEAGSSSRESSVHAAGAAARGLPRSSSSASASAAGGAPTRPPAAAALGPPPPLAAVCLDGAQSVVVDELAPRQALAVRLQLLALGAGQQALPPLVLASERDGRVYATLPPLELFVDAA